MYYRMLLVDIVKNLRFEYGFGVLPPICWKNLSYHHDALGLMVMLTNNKSHVVENYQRYYVYGKAYKG